MKFQVVLSDHAFKFLKSLDKKSAGKVITVVDALSDFSSAAKIFDLKKLKGKEDFYRIRLGKLRLIFKVLWNDHVIRVEIIDWRGKSYKNI